MKNSIKAAGAMNINEKTATRAGKALKKTETLLRETEKELSLKKRSSRHTMTTSEKDFKILVKQATEVTVIFAFVPGRQFKAYPMFSRNLLHKMDMTSFHRWINKHKSKWQKQAKARSIMHY